MLSHDLTLAFFSNLRGWDLLVIALFGLLLFGRRLPEIGKNIGRSIVEFKKGLKSKDEEAPAEEETPKQIASGTPSSKSAKNVKATSSDEP